MTDDNRIVASMSARYLATWTPDHFDAAIAMSDGGALEAAADFTLAVMHDDRVRGVSSTRTLGLLGLPMTWAADPARPVHEQPIEPPGWHALAPEAEQNRLLSWGLHLGVGFAYVQPWGALETWHPRWFRWDEERRCWYAQTRRNGEVPVIPGRGWVVFTPYGEREPWQYGLWLTLAIPFLAKRFAIHDRARASEVFGSAMVVGEAPEGATEKQRNKFLTDLDRLARAARIVLPQGFKVDLVEAQGQTWGIYDQSIKWADDAITVAIAGQLTTTNGQSGWSRGDVHERIAQSLTRFGAEAFSTCLGRQYVPQVWGAVRYPHWDVDPPGDRLTAVASSLVTFGNAVTTANAALAPYNKRVDVAAYVKDFDEIKLMPLLQTPDVGNGAEFFAYELEGGVFTINEFRSRKGLPPIPGGDVTKPERDARIAATGSADPPPAVETESEVPAPDHAAALAAKLTAAGVDRCRHGSVNRCRICLIERDEDFAIDPATGETVWAVKWRPLAQAMHAQSMHVQAVRGRAQTDVGGEPPAEFRIFAAGPNPVDSGDAIVWFTPRSADLIMAQMGSRDLMIDLEHMSLSGQDPDARGWAKVEPRNGELWAVKTKWLPDGDRRIRNRLQRSISPTFLTDSKTGEIVQLINCALTALPAMPFAATLIAASKRKVQNAMDPKLLEMLGLPPDATPEQVIEAVAALKMVATKAGEAAPAPAPAPPPQAAPAAPPAPAPPPQAMPPQPQAQSVGDALIQSMAAELAAMKASNERAERERLIAGAPLSPLEREWLATQPLEAARTYVQNVAGKRAGEQPPAGAPGPDASIDAVAKATGLDRSYVRSARDGK